MDEADTIVVSIPQQSTSTLVSPRASDRTTQQSLKPPPVRQVISQQRMPPQPSSSLTPPPSSDLLGKQVFITPSLRQYRPARQLPFELAQHVQSYCEEALFTRAFEHLISVTTNSISSMNASLPVFVPPATQLSLAATVAVHPAFATRSTDLEKHNQANAALRLLRLMLDIVGPVNLVCTEAFRFRKYDYRLAEVDEEDNADVGRLNTRYASSDSMFTRADDFWAIVGWALNCACLRDPHAARWVHWQLWLSYILDVLETDWIIHEGDQSSEESLIWQYIELASGGHGRARRIVRATFADGSTRSLNEFREVFNNELKAPPEEKQALKKREEVDVDAEVYGDYLENDSDLSDSEPPDFRASKRQRTRTPSTRRTTPRSSSGTLRSDYEDDAEAVASAATTTLGSSDCILSRMRLLRLLLHISSHPTLLSTSPTTFPDLEELYTLFVEFIRPLPLQIFSQFILPNTPTDILSIDTHIYLCELLLQRMLESAAQSTRSSELTERVLRKHYLPHAAGKNDIESQAKVGLLLEAVLRRCAAAGMYNEVSAERKAKLERAIEKGIERRRSKAQEGQEHRKGRKKSGGALAEADSVAWELFWASAERMRVVVNSLQ